MPMCDLPLPFNSPTSHTHTRHATIVLKAQIIESKA